MAASRQDFEQYFNVAITREVRLSRLEFNLNKTLAIIDLIYTLERRRIILIDDLINILFLVEIENLVQLSSICIGETFYFDQDKLRGEHLIVYMFNGKQDLYSRSLWNKFLERDRDHLILKQRIGDECITKDAASSTINCHYNYRNYREDHLKYISTFRTSMRSLHSVSLSQLIDRYKLNIDKLSRNRYNFPTPQMEQW